jgi:hypothetical protein
MALGRGNGGAVDDRNSPGGHADQLPGVGDIDNSDAGAGLNIDTDRVVSTVNQLLGDRAAKPALSAGDEHLHACD